MCVYMYLDSCIGWFCSTLRVPYVRRVYLCYSLDRFEGFATRDATGGTSRRDARRRDDSVGESARATFTPARPTRTARANPRDAATRTRADDDDARADAGVRDGDARDARRATRDVDSRRAMRATDARGDAPARRARGARRDRVQRDEDGALVQPHEQEGFVRVRRAREREADEARPDPVPGRDDAEGGRDGERRE